MQLITLTAAALAVAAPVVSAGKANIYNKCSGDVHLWVCSTDGEGEMQTISSQSSWSQSYQTPSSGGVSLKLSQESSVSEPITQFEYTLDGMIWYDISNVNCQGEDCPFQKEGMYMDTSVSTCPTRSCQGGLANCVGAYNQPDDDENSLACSSDSDINLYLCTSESSNSTSTKREYGVPAHRRRHARVHQRHYRA